jgi:predicted ABC-type ATPase
VSNKELIVVGGPNGAGKSTFIAGFLSEHAWPYLSADLIAAELAPHNPASRQVEAGRLFLDRLEVQLAGDGDFVVETTLSGRTWKNYFATARESGFELTIAFIFLDSSETSIARVKERVRRGGHDVPEDDIRRRFKRSARNFWHIYRQIADRWTVVYNAGGGFVDVAIGTQDEFMVSDEELFRSFLAITEIEGNG